MFYVMHKNLLVFWSNGPAYFYIVKGQCYWTNYDQINAFEKASRLRKLTGCAQSRKKDQVGWNSAGKGLTKLTRA